MKTSLTVLLSFLHRDLTFGADDIVKNKRPLFGEIAIIRLNWDRFDDMMIRKPSDFQTAIDQMEIVACCEYLSENDKWADVRPSKYHQPQPGL